MFYFSGSKEGASRDYFAQRSFCRPPAVWVWYKEAAGVRGDVRRGFILGNFIFSERRAKWGCGIDTRREKRYNYYGVFLAVARHSKYSGKKDMQKPKQLKLRFTLHVQKAVGASSAFGIFATAQKQYPQGGKIKIPNSMPCSTGPKRLWGHCPIISN